MAIENMNTYIVIYYTDLNTGKGPKIIKLMAIENMNMLYTMAKY